MNKNTPINCLSALSIAAAVLLPTAKAADVPWIGNPEDPVAPQLWGSGVNWQTGTVPTSTDNAVINNGGTAQIVSGDTFTNAETWIGNGGGTVGTVTQTGGTFNAQSWFVVGRGGSQGTFDMSGGTLNKTNAGRIVVGEGGGSNGTMTLRGNAVVNANESNEVGSDGTGILNIQDTAQYVITNGEINIGRGGSGNGTVNISGGTYSTDFFFGVGRDGGTGVLNITGGAVSKGTAGDRFAIANQGDMSTGTVNVSAGSLSIDANLEMGGGTNNASALNVSGGDTTVTGVSRLNSGAVGSTGSNLISVAGGTLTHNGETWIGEGPANGNEANTYTVSGSGVVNANNWFVVGRNGGAGTLNIEGGTLIKSGNGQFDVAANGASKGTVNLNGGTLIVPRVITEGGGFADGGSATFNFNGGTLKANGPASDFMQGLTAANVRNGGAIIDSDGNDIAIVQDLIHSIIGGDSTVDGGLTKLGAGTLTLSGANTYTGDTRVVAGQLTIFSGFLSDTANVYLSTGSTFNLFFFDGPDTVLGLYFDGVSQAVGTWGAIGSGAEHESTLFGDVNNGAGFGMINVTATIPEPSDLALLAVGLTILGGLRLRVLVIRRR